MMQKEGLDAKALGVQWVSVGGDSARMQALLAGRVDATINHVEFLPRAQQAGFKAIASTSEMLPNYVRFATVASEKTLRDRYEELVRFCTALTRGIRYCMDHREETIELGVRLVKRDRDDVARTYDWFAQNNGLEPNFYFPPEGLRYLQELNVRLGTQARILPPEEMATWEVQKRVVAALGTYRR